MGCGNCSSGGCGTLPAGCKNNGNCGTSGCNKLEVFDWLTGMERTISGESEFVEVRFKNTRKEIYKNSNNIGLNVGDAVVVEAQSGYDIGMVSVTGELVKFQMKKLGISLKASDTRRTLRKATEEDLTLYSAAREQEAETITKSRRIARELKLDMKISDVEYQADKTKAIFYYIAEGRIDFRELIKVLADSFKVRIEMRQIGARQEAGRVGGIGSCGRELCCSTWLTDFRTVSTSAARYQQLSINPMKLAGQCGKLKCCLNYELDSYMDALKDFPDARVKLKTKRGVATHQKSDIFRGMMWYTYEDNHSEFIPLEIDRVREVIAANAEGKLGEDLANISFKELVTQPEIKFDNVVGQEDLTRFDTPKRSKNKKRKGNQVGDRGPRPAQENKSQQSSPSGTQQNREGGEKKNNRNNRRRKPRPKGDSPS